MSSTTIPRRCHASTSWPVTAGVTSAPSSSSGARAGRRRASSRSLGSFSAWARSGRSCSRPCAISGPPTSISSPSASIFAPPRSTSRSRATTRRTNSRSSGRPVAPWVSLTSSRGPSCAPRITPSATSTAFLQATDHEQARDCSVSVGGSGGGAALLPAATDHDPARDCSVSVGGSGGGAALLPAATDHDPPRDRSASVGGLGEEQRSCRQQRTMTRLVIAPRRWGGWGRSGARSPPGPNGIHPHPDGVRGVRPRGGRASRHPRLDRSAALLADQDGAFRVRQGSRRPARGALRHQVLDHRHLLHHLRHRATLRLAVGHGIQEPRLVRLLGHAGFPGRAHARVSLHMAETGARMGVGSFFTSRLDEAIGWARKFSIFQYPFVTACCGMEYMATACSHYDVDRFGAGLPRFSPRQADVLFVVGTISHKMAPVLKRIYDQMCEPKWVVAFGVCTCTGGFYDNYATVMGIDTIIPVDVYIPGCPPRPESVIDGLMKLQDKIAAGAQRF